MLLCLKHHQYVSQFHSVWCGSSIPVLALVWLLSCLVSVKFGVWFLISCLVMWFVSSSFHCIIVKPIFISNNNNSFLRLLTHHSVDWWLVGWWMVGEWFVGCLSNLSGCLAILFCSLVTKIGLVLWWTYFSSQMAL